MSKNKPVLTSVVMSCFAILFSFMPCIYMTGKSEVTKYTSSGHWGTSRRMLERLESMPQMLKNVYYERQRLLFIIAYILFIGLILTSMIVLINRDKYYKTNINMTPVILSVMAFITFAYFSIFVSEAYGVGYISGIGYVNPDAEYIEKIWDFEEMAYGFYVELILLAGIIVLNFLIVTDKISSVNNKITSILHQKCKKDNINDIEKYKILLDNGTITQEEFDAKKKQLLGL